MSVSPLFSSFPASEAFASLSFSAALGSAAVHACVSSVRTEVPFSGCIPRSRVYGHIRGRELLTVALPAVRTAVGTALVSVLFAEQFGQLVWITFYI